MEETTTMMRKLLGAAQYILGLDIPGPNVAVYPDDTFIVSYPKSGNTWMRFLIANLIHQNDPVTFANIEQVIPHCEGQSKRFFKTMPRPRFIKCHECFDPRYPKVIYIVRDPRDVVVSQYYFQRKGGAIDDSYPIERFVTRFVAGETSRPPRYGSWADNVASWLALRQSSPRFMLIRYEDILAQTSRELTRIASFLGIEATPEQLAAVLERSSADQMRKLEKVQAEVWTQTKNTRQDIPFIRSAHAGGWKSKLPESSAVEMESAWAPLMKRLGYEVSLRKVVEAGVDRIEK
jgi:hypothetical protein